MPSGRQTFVPSGHQLLCLITCRAFLSIFECEFELVVNWKVVDLQIPFPKHIFKVQSEQRGLRYDFSKKVSPYFQLSNSATPLTLVLLPLRLDLTLKLLFSRLSLIHLIPDLCNNARHCFLAPNVSLSPQFPTNATRLGVDIHIINNTKIRYPDNSILN